VPVSSAERQRCPAPTHSRIRARRTGHIAQRGRYEVRAQAAHVAVICSLPRVPPLKPALRPQRSSRQHNAPHAPHTNKHCRAVSLRRSHGDPTIRVDRPALHPCVLRRSPRACERATCLLNGASTSSLPGSSATHGALDGGTPHPVEAARRVQRGRPGLPQWNGRESSGRPALLPLELLLGS
jgi:hypothetical protein